MIKHTANVHAYSPEQIEEIMTLTGDVKQALIEKREITINEVTFVPKQASLETSNHGSSLKVEGYIL